MSRRTDARNGESYSQESSSVSRRNVLRSGAAGAAVIGGMTLSGCIGGDGGDGGENEIAIISSDAGFDDQAFNSLAIEGLESAQEEYDFSINQIEETNTSNFGARQADAAETSPDLIVCVGFQHTTPLCGGEETEGNANEYPDQNWMLINDNCDTDNVAGYAWANHEMSFLAGVQAGTLTTEDISAGGGSTDPDNATVGFVGGVDGALINAFEEAYIAGVEYVNSDVEVTSGYAGTFTDPSAANDVATSQIESGVDIIYQAAAGAGRGAIQACQDNDIYAIGVDADQSKTLPDLSDVIIGSAVKYINLGTENVASAIYEDEFDPLTGELNILGLDDDGAVDLVVGQEFEGEFEDTNLSQNLEDAKTDIREGNVEVPCSATGC